MSADFPPLRLVPCLPPSPQEAVDALRDWLRRDMADWRISVTGKVHPQIWRPPALPKQPRVEG